MGRDGVLSISSVAFSCFNPRARMGRDPGVYFLNVHVKKFQPTRPHGARLLA